MKDDNEPGAPINEVAALCIATGMLLIILAGYVCARHQIGLPLL